MEKKIVKASIVIILLCSANMPVMAASKGKCDDYHQAIRSNCNSGSGGVKSGSVGACFGAQLGALFAGC